MYSKRSYWPGGGASAAVTGAASVTAGVAAGAGAAFAVCSGTSTVFQSSSASTVRAIRVPTLISFVPSATCN